MLDLSDRPKRPRPFHVPNGMEVFKSIWVRDDLNGVTKRHVLVYLLSGNQSPSIFNHVAVVFALGDSVRPYSILRFAGLTVTHSAEELHAINLPIRRYG